VCVVRVAGVKVARRLHLAGGELAGQHNPAAFLSLFGQLLGDLWVMRSNIADQAGQEAV